MEISPLSLCRIRDEISPVMTRLWFLHAFSSKMRGYVLRRFISVCSLELLLTKESCTVWLYTIELPLSIGHV